MACVELRAFLKSFSHFRIILLICLVIHLSDLFIHDENFKATKNLNICTSIVPLYRTNVLALCFHLFLAVCLSW